MLSPVKGWLLAMLAAARLGVAPVPPTAPLTSAVRDGFGDLVGSEERRAFGVPPKNASKTRKEG